MTWKEKIEPVSIKAYCDGSCKGNPGPASYAYMLMIDNKVVEIFSRYIGQGTNIVAEYHAIIGALDACSNWGKINVAIFSDSEVVVNQINGMYRINAPHLIELFKMCEIAEKKLGSAIYVFTNRDNPLIDAVDKLAKKMVGYHG